MSQNDAAKGGGSYRLDITYKNRGNHRQDALQTGHPKKGLRLFSFSIEIEPDKSDALKKGRGFIGKVLCVPGGDRRSTGLSARLRAILGRGDESFFGC